MAGRGDKKKPGIPGRGAGNPLIPGEEIQPRSVELEEPKIESLTRADEKRFDLVVDDVPYLVKASPFSFNGETRFYVDVNGSGEHVFTWDSAVGRLRAIDDNASILPDALEEAISQKLQAQVK